jgi:hypothetical protein
MNNLNPYNEVKFEQQFKLTNTYQQVVKDFDVICFSDNHNYEAIRGTPREWYGTKIRRSVFSLVPFYYISYLTQHNPTKIYDIGCGWNIFKKYIPNIIGIAGEKPDTMDYHGDEYGWVDERYIQDHQGYFESAFSINSLHFVHLTHIRQRVLDIVSMIAPGGRLFLSLNLARMIEVDPKFNGWSMQDVDTWVRNQLDNMPFTYEVFECTYFENKDEFLNGNIRMVIWNKTT